MLKKGLLLIGILLPTVLFAYEQQYVSQQENYKPYVPNLHSQILKETKPKLVPTSSFTKTINTNNHVQYTTKEQQVWFKSCLGSIKNPKVKPYAMNFCACGWKRITSGELPANLLISTNKTDIAKANKILQVIYQECMVQVMSRERP